MTRDISSFTINVDVTNPGQFFACCGLLELAHRLWLGVEGMFEEGGEIFTVYSPNDPSVSLQQLVQGMIQCKISGLTATEQQEREALEAEKNQLKKENKQLSEEKEKRRKELGTMARAGAISLGDPFGLDLNWWQTSDEEVNTPKTWAGLQEIHKVARAAQDTFARIDDLRELFNHRAVLRMPKEYAKNANDQKKAVEPFYFDARRFAHALDIGFSLDVQGAETIVHPAVELLALIGLQRFRPGGSDRKWEFAYTAWSTPLSAPVAAAVASGAVSIDSQRRYRFRLLFRDDQRRYKAFSHATQIGGLT